MDINYLTEDEITEVVRTNDNFRQKSATGYGKKIPTQYKIRLTNGKTYRMYCMIYSSVGSCYIVQNGALRHTGNVEYGYKFQNPTISNDIKF